MKSNSITTSGHPCGCATPADIGARKNQTLSAFLRGFADGASLGYDTADAQWAAYSRQLSDTGRARIEAGGYPAGYKEGKAFAIAFRGKEEK